MLIIFTDLDGTLLDHNNYSFEAAREALKEIKEKNVPLILCTSKTRAETTKFQEELAITEPFIVENGGAIYIPEKYFSFEIKEARKKDGFLIIEYGTPIKKLLEELKSIKDVETKGFSDMTIKEVSEDTGLTIEEARLAKKREYDEAFKIIKGKEEELRKEIIAKGLNYTRGGRYSHVMGNNDKGRAVKKLIELYKKELKEVMSIALGDSPNDFPMLEAADKGILVRKHDNTYSSESFKKAEGIGPIGWNKAVLKEVSDYSTQGSNG